MDFAKSCSVVSVFRPSHLNVAEFYLFFSHFEDGSFVFTTSVCAYATEQCIPYGTRRCITIESMPGTLIQRHYNVVCSEDNQLQ